MEHKPENNENKKDRIAFFGFLFASVCFYAAAARAILCKDGGNWISSFCLGSAFLCLSQTHQKQDQNKNGGSK